MGTEKREPGSSIGRVIVGLAIAVAGVVMLMDRTGFTLVHLSWRYWPLIPIALGLVRFVDPPECEGRRSRRSGAWLIYVGFWGLVSEFQVLGLDYSTSWPLLVVGVGAGIVWGAFDPRCAHSARSMQNE